MKLLRHSPLSSKHDALCGYSRISAIFSFNNNLFDVFTFVFYVFAQIGIFIAWHWSWFLIPLHVCMCVSTVRIANCLRVHKLRAPICLACDFIASTRPSDTQNIIIFAAARVCVWVRLRMRVFNLVVRCLACDIHTRAKKKENSIGIDGGDAVAQPASSYFFFIIVGIRPSLSKSNNKQILPSDVT